LTAGIALAKFLSAKVGFTQLRRRLAGMKPVPFPITKKSKKSQK
jgi:hypothetical protein